ncbi:MAG: NUDIX hydrolase [Muribaculaceae bacterium]|nr:NUDIX hydrolase [Muribaculaceae bacterium]MDE6794099.1 NUDIX hydrolase [Muribaculaceae bacterium]
MTSPINHYSHLSKFYVAVDCIIFAVIHGKLHLLLVKRNFEPEMGKWSLIGGFVNDDESVDVAAKRVLGELTGLDNVFIRQLGAFGEIDRDPGARVISVAYFALLNLADVDQEAVSQHNATWVAVDALPPLGFDHQEMIDRALDVMRRKILTGSFAFNLLPEFFTLTQLQTLVESVTGKELDKRNFRKSISDNPFIELTGLIDKSTSKRGARLYRYINN